MQQTNGRKRFLINPKFQFAFMGYMVVTAMMMIGIFYGANVYFIDEFRDMGRSVGLAPNHVFFAFLNEQNQKLTLFFGVSAGVAFVSLCIVGLFMSHRVAGPLYRLQRYMEDVTAGNDVGDVKFRKRDFFPELADGMNNVMRRYRGDKDKAA